MNRRQNDAAERPGDASTPGGFAGPTAPDSSRADRRVLGVLTILLVSITLLQRFAIPVGASLSISVVVAAAALAYLAYQGDLQEIPGGVRFFAVAMGTCCLATGVVLVTAGYGSMTSLVYLVITWAVFCFRLHPNHHHLYPRFLDRFEKLMVALAGVGLLQTLAQAVGAWTYQDFILAVVPKAFLFTGYNTSYPLQYGSSIIKANAFVFVEPSVYAQFLGMALLSTLVRRAHPLRAVVIAAALVATISGTGLLLVVFGILVLAIRRGGLWAARIAVAGFFAAVGALLSPLGEIFLSRTGEASETNSSGSLRFVQPYQRLIDTWNDDPVTLLVGRGAGYADDLADQIFRATNLPINFSGIAKLILEYGIPAALLFAAFVTVVMLRRAPSPTLAITGLFANAVLTGSLLQPQVLYLMALVTTLFSGYGFERNLDAGRRRRDDEEFGTTAGGLPPVSVTIAPADPNGLRRNP